MQALLNSDACICAALSVRFASGVAGRCRAQWFSLCVFFAAFAAFAFPGSNAA
jgi:hypothetical protein